MLANDWHNTSIDHADHTMNEMKAIDCPFADTGCGLEEFCVHREKGEDVAVLLLRHVRKIAGHHFADHVGERGSFSAHRLLLARNQLLGDVLDNL